MRLCCTWLRAAEQYFPEYLNAAAIPVCVRRGRHNRTQLGDGECSLSQFINRLNYSSISRAACVPTWRTD